MANFFAELKRRHIYRVGAAYVVAAWGVAQVIDLLSQVFALPAWIAQPVIMVIAVGFPIALLITWVVESKPQQVIASAVRSKPTTLDWMLFSAVAVLIALSGYRLIAPSSDMATRQTGVEAARAAAASPATGLSVAVLPFTNLSSDPEQEFFSAGITEEITSALARVPDLRVVARTSAFQFKDQNRDIQAIAQVLRATHLIEGSVRRAGDRVRITAQLINAGSGASIWTDSYDRQLTDVFAIQEDIATAIAGALRMPLGLKQGQSLVHGTQNLSTYQAYLQAKAWYRERASPLSGPFLQTLESAVARDPGFAPAWAVLADAYRFQITSSPAVAQGPLEGARRVVQSFRMKAENAARKAMELDPRHPGGYRAMANIKWQGGEWAASEDFVKEGLALDPNDPDFLFTYSNLLLRTGQVKQALSVSETLLSVEPLLRAYETQAAMIMAVNGQNEAAVAAFEAIPANTRGGLSYRLLARAHAGAGRYGQAADTLLEGVRVTDPRNRKGMEDAAAIIRSAPKKAADQKALPSLGDGEGDLFFVYAHVGALERVLDYPEREAQIGYMPDWGKTLWEPAMAPVRKTDRFKALVRKTGLVDYWRANGWPDLCRPQGADDFVCD